MYKIVRRQVFSPETFLWEVEAPDVARAAQPGHFVMLRLHEGSERIPLTVADFDRERGTITMVIQALGKTTREMMNEYAEGASFRDFVGPLGLPAHTGKVGHVVCVGGGLGVAPVYPQLRAFHEAGNRTTGIIGFRSQNRVFWEEPFGRYSDELVVCTDDGSYGRPGFVTVALEQVLSAAEHKPDMVVAIGPLGMMRACVEVAKKYDVPAMVSLNAIMVDGTGMCGSCRVTVGGDVKFACVDGPDFDGHKVDFNELMTRQRRFADREKVAVEDFDHVCNLEKQLIQEGKKNYKKIKELAPHQTKMPERDATERAQNFKEVNLGYDMADAMAEAERCIQCAKPTCIAGCPVAIDIPRFIRHLIVRDLGGAADALNEANLFPSICGRVCPQESQCEAQCIIAKKMEPVAIGRLERFVGDNAPAKKTEPPVFAHKLGKVAIVGSGPAGLAAAADLVRYGADVTIYEALHVVGGVLRYGIPSFRLPREIITREVARLTDMGVKVETNKVIGKTFTIPQLMGEMGYDSVFVGAGAGAPSFLGIPGEFAGQVYSANEFLTRVNLMGGDRFPFQDTPVNIGNRVVVIGAGNTAMDCLRVARRLGSETVHCVYRRTEAEAPARVEEIRHAKEEGIHFHWLRSPTEIHVDEKGNVKGMTVEVMTLGEPDASGRRKPVPTDAFQHFECDTVIYALGTKANPIVARSTPGLNTNMWGNITANDDTQATSLPGVFAGGDIVTGGATVILAMGAGRRAAKAIGYWLQTRQWPVTKEALDAWVAPVAQSGANASPIEVAVSRPASGDVRTCPRCNQPLEDDESYVCCAGTQLAWTCTQCHKVSEGFAFPYGLCPACDGELTLRGDTTVAGAEQVAAIRHAFEIELGGMAFYTRAAEETPDPDMKAFFLKLAEMESQHLTTLQRRYHLEVHVPTVSLSPTRAAVFTDVKVDLADPVSIFRVAIGLEKRALAFFAAQAGKLPKGSAEQRLYRELEAEEQEHVDLLGTELGRYVQGKPGLL